MRNKRLGKLFVHSFSFPLFREGCGMLPLFIPLGFCGAYWGHIQFNSWAKARVQPEWVASSLQDPYWWQWLPHRVPTAHQEQFWGSVSCSRILRHVAQSHPRGAGVSNQRPSDHLSTSSTHSYSRPLPKKKKKLVWNIPQVNRLIRNRWLPWWGIKGASLKDSIVHKQRWGEVHHFVNNCVSKWWKLWPLCCWGRLELPPVPQNTESSFIWQLCLICSLFP